MYNVMNIVYNDKCTFLSKYTENNFLLYLNRNIINPLLITCYSSTMIDCYKTIYI